MKSRLSLPPEHDLDTQMLRVARDIAMDIYPIAQILQNNDITVSEFNRWKEHPRFLEYLRAETEAWRSATNTVERTKLKAAVVMEEFMSEAYTNLHDKKIALNHRVELGKLVAKIAGMGEPKILNAGNGAPTFQLKINISPGKTGVTVNPTFGKIINHDDAPAINAIPEDNGFDMALPIDINIAGIADDDDGYNPLVSPSTLDD